MTSEEDWVTLHSHAAAAKAGGHPIRINEMEMCFVVTCGFSEIYDIFDALNLLVY